MHTLLLSRFALSYQHHLTVLPVLTLSLIVPTPLTCQHVATQDRQLVAKKGLFLASTSRILLILSSCALQGFVLNLIRRNTKVSERGLNVPNHRQILIQIILRLQAVGLNPRLKVHQRIPVIPVSKLAGSLPRLSQRMAQGANMLPNRKVSRCTVPSGNSVTSNVLPSKKTRFTPPMSKSRKLNTKGRLGKTGLSTVTQSSSLGQLIISSQPSLKLIGKS